MQTESQSPLDRVELPAADAAGLVLLGLLLSGWILVARALVVDAVLVAAATTLLFWLPLRLLDRVRHGRVRRNDICRFLGVEMPQRALWAAGFPKHPQGANFPLRKLH